MAKHKACSVRWLLQFLSYPEILAIGQEKLDQWITESSKLAVHKQSFEDLFRQQAHVRSAEVEEILGLVSDPLGGASNSTSMLTNADFQFKSVG